MSILKKGDQIAVIAPSLSIADITVEDKAKIENNFKKLCLSVVYSNNCWKKDYWCSSSVDERICDIHEAICNPSISAVWCARGGSNCNQLLKKIDYALLKKHPKPFIGYSDITVLLNALYCKTKIVMFYAPNYNTLKNIMPDDYTMDSICNILMENWVHYCLKPSFQSEYWILNSGRSQGIIVGGNLPSFQLLQGTSYMPDLRGKILFVEYDDMAGKYTLDEFDRDLEGLFQNRGADHIRGLIIGRFPKKACVTKKKLSLLLAGKDYLKSIPVVANVDFGHTLPFSPIPIGGKVIVDTNSQDVLKLKFF